MSVTREGVQILFKRAHRSHVAGKHSPRFAAKIKENLEKQCARLERELSEEARKKAKEEKPS